MLLQCVLPFGHISQRMDRKILLLCNYVCYLGLPASSVQHDWLTEKSPSDDTNAFLKSSEMYTQSTHKKSRVPLIKDALVQHLLGTSKKKMLACYIDTCLGVLVA